ncbi:MAG TPA: TIGR03118 family protein [Terriglobales bacterium]|jgi:uncharacterized protein (TIGR03118 family)|nr:TIGR03118 family protein [Terriglobales bacterium]
MPWCMQKSAHTALFTLALVATGFSTLASAQRYSQTNLVSDVAAWAPTVDAHLKNAWGIAYSATSPVWVADNGTGVSTLYTGTGAIVPLVVTVPRPAGGMEPATPTGIVFNGNGGFNVTDGGRSGSSIFIFDTEDGTISGWNPTVVARRAKRMVDNSGMGAVYKGLAIGTTAQGTFLYATNFNSGWVEIYDSQFQWVKNFTDMDIPDGYGPFGIRNINGKLYVTYAKQDADKHDDVAGVGLGFVDVFDLNGNKIKRLVSKGALNSPWGLALAPSNFGKFSGALLVGNFGDGRIDAYNISTGAWLGRFLRANGSILSIDGLWGLSFGTGGTSGPTNTLLFTAGPDHESHGLFGTLTAIP